MQNIFDIILVPFGYVLRFAYSLTNNYLFAIFLFTLLMEILLFPIVIKQQKNQIKQASLSPRVRAIQKKYAGRTDQATKQRMQQEIMDMYKEENFNPASGCLPLLIQLPIILVLYNVITNPLRYISNVSAENITRIKEFVTGNLGIELNVRTEQLQLINVIRDNFSTVSSQFPDVINESTVLPNFKVLGLDLSQVPSLTFNPFDWLMLIPVITFVVMILSQFIMQKFTYQSPEQQEASGKISQKIMMWTMPLLSVYFEFQLAAAIGIYWIFRNILQVVEKIIVSKIFPLPKFTEEDYKAAEKKENTPEKIKKAENTKFVRSLHHIDDEEYIERHKEELEQLEEEAQRAREAKPALPTLPFGKKKNAKKDGDAGSEETTENKEESKDTANDVTTSKAAPAPIKNDEKSKYKKKKK